MGRLKKKETWGKKKKEKKEPPFDPGSVELALAYVGQNEITNDDFGHAWG